MKQKFFTVAKSWYEYDEKGYPIGGIPLIYGGPKFSKIEHLKRYVKKAYGIEADKVNVGFSWDSEEKKEKSTIIFSYKIVEKNVNY